MSRDRMGHCPDGIDIEFNTHAGTTTNCSPVDIIDLAIGPGDAYVSANVTGETCCAVC